MRDHVLTYCDLDLERLPAGFGAPDYLLDVSDCFALRELPDPLSVPVLIARGCAALERLPRGLDVVDLDVAGCLRLRALPERLGPELGRLVVRDCAALAALPERLARVAELDVSGCPLLRRFPRGLVVTRSLELAGTAVEVLPELGPRARLRWRGVAVPADVVLHPERITVEDVLTEPNAELRRVLVERMGYQRFAGEAGATTLDRDEDPGGPRALLRVEVPDDEPLLLLSVRCPSTARSYLLRVPPATRTCHEAAAWIAGFDHPIAYAPVRET